MSSNNRIGRIGDWNGSGSSSGGRAPGGARITGFGDLGGRSGGGPPSGPGGGAPGRPRVDDDDDDEDEDDDESDRQGETWFAGGERSGISVQNPNAPGGAPSDDLVRELLQRAAQGGREAPPPANTSSWFSGGGHSLGGEGVDSAYVPDPNAADQEQPSVVRNITLWQDGFTIEDGELLDYNTPENRALLQLINSGRAPPAVLNVEIGQPVELRISQRRNEKYVAPKRAMRAFGGEGNRLGAPVPSTSTSTSIPGEFPADSSEEPPSRRAADTINALFELDQTLPSTSIQLRLADGTRMVCRMNQERHTVQDLRNYINAARPENHARPYTISTTFPTKILDDNTLTIKQAGLENSVVVQRWA